ncbi:MAG: response regulator [Abitibacteriaceae bacterium]|nr:response regulator [Abditibacteriaceae bacterium]
MRILYVDDHERFRQVTIKQFLSTHQVTIAGTLAQARHLLSHQQFDCVLLDYDLPDGKGIELIDDLRRLGLLNQVTAISSIEDNNAALTKAGAFAALSKLRFAHISEILKQLG